MSLVCADENITSTLEDVNIEVNDVSMYYKNGSSLDVALSDSVSEPLSNQSVIFTINNVNYTRTTNDAGKASIAINLLPGKYLSNVYFLGNDKYSSSNKTVNINVLPTISGNDLVKYYRNDSQYEAMFVDGSGRPLGHASVIFNINGVFYTRVTDEKGVASLNINLNSGDYILTAYNPNDGFQYSNNIHVLPTLNGSDLVKIYKDSHQYLATFRDNKGSALVNSEVQFNINGVFYIRLTDGDGNAKLNINLEQGKYVITAYNICTGESAFNYVIVYGNSDTKLTTQNHVFKPTDDDVIQATLINKLNYGVAGENIALTIGKNHYSAITDDDGVASFYLDLKQGNYSLTFNHEANSVYGASQASSTVETYGGINAKIDCSDDVVIRGSPYTAVLYDKNNRAFANQTLYLKIGHHVYSAITDEKGSANFKLDMPEGNYEAIVYYNGTGYKFTRHIVQLICIESTKTKLTPYTSSVTECAGEKFNVYLSAGQVKLSDKEVIIEINGNNYTRVTDGDGIAGLIINLGPGTYNVKYYYLGDNIFDASSGSSNLLVKPRISTQLNVLSNSKYHKNSGISYNIELKADKVMSGTEITLKINSKTYTQKTDENGVAHFNISDLAVGKYLAEYSFDGDKRYAPSKASSSLEITSEIPYGYGYWVRYSDMYSLNLASLASQGTKHILLHSYVFTAYGESSVVSWINQANKYGINVHIWMQVAYDGSWHALSDRDGVYDYNYINSKINQAKYYAGVSGVSGVHFDYLRYGGTAYKFPKAAESINYFVSNAVSSVKAVNPNCLVSAAVMPEPDRMLYYDGQDFPTLSRYFDFIVPMAYKGNYAKNTAWIQEVTKWFVDNSNGAQIWTGLQAYRSDDDITRLSVSELTGDSQASLNGGARGVIMFRWGVTNYINFNNLVMK